MRSRCVLALVPLAVIAVAAPAAATPGGIIIPPTAVELGAGTPLGDGAEVTASSELRVGASWASLAWKPTRMDITVGYAGSYRNLLPGSDGVRSHRAADLGGALEELRLHGLYMELAYALESHRHWRTWLGARIESLHGDYRERPLTVFGAALRVGSELYASGARAGGDRGAIAMFAGAFAVGVYVEGVVRNVPVELGPVGVGAGVSMRVPFIAALVN
jgi:hypothetical protein